MTDHTRSLKKARIATSVAFGLQGFLLASILTQLPAYRDLFALSESLLVVAVVSVSVIAGLGSVLAERLAVRTSSKTTLRTGLAVIAVFGGATGLAPNSALFFVCLAVYGIGLGIVDAAANMQAVSIQHAKGRFILSSFHAAWSVGAIAGALYISATAGLDISVRVTQVVAGVIVALLLLVFGPSLLDRSATSVGDTNTGGSVTLTVPMRAFVLLGIAMALFYAVDFSIGNWSTLYLEDVLLADASTAALSMAAYQIAALVARLTGDYWVGKFGETAVVRMGSVIGVIGMTIVVTAQSPAIAIAGFLIVGLGLPVIAPICFSAAGRMAPPDQVDTVIARINLFNYVGTVVGGGIVGAVAAFSDLRIGFLIPLAFCVILIALAPAFAPKRAESLAAEKAG
ncbi:MFS transporter [Rhodococcus globerulus]|uniref:MFS transporter n=1 Tax=Rhodococcus globerulus TaxID=33008 RepID=A0ABU4BMC7_RHOGO|nr:MFS transporter [Rhodococcus globerulus]MDV6265367.1 MFS transporter [Rhodococcus globerulus]